jgi:hypothetical protein
LLSGANPVPIPFANRSPRLLAVIRIAIIAVLAACSAYAENESPPTPPAVTGTGMMLTWTLDGKVQGYGFGSNEACRRAADVLSRRPDVVIIERCTR